MYIENCRYLVVLMLILLFLLRNANGACCFLFCFDSSLRNWMFSFLFYFNFLLFSLLASVCSSLFLASLYSFLLFYSSFMCSFLHCLFFSHTFCLLRDSKTPHWITCLIELLLPFSQDWILKTFLFQFVVNFGLFFILN